VAAFSPALAAAIALLLVVLSTCTAAVPPSGTALPETSAGPTASAAVTAVLPPNKIQILHTNDIHGHIDSAKVTTGGRTFEQGGLALVGGMIQAQRARAPGRTLVLDGGDAWVGTLISAVDKGRSVIQAMSLIGYDAMALGNHDFDWGQDELTARAKEASFPFLTSNVVDGAFVASPPFAKPYIVKDLGIAKVGIIGVTCQSSTIIKASSVAGLRFLPAIDSVRRVLPEVQKQSDVIVVVSHMGIEGGSGGICGGDTALAKAVPGIDLIIGAHDHSAFRTARVAGTTKIFQTGSYTDNLGRVEITIDPATKKVAAVQGSDVLLTVSTGAAAPQPDVAKLIEARRAEADKYGARVIGRTTEFLQADRDMNNPLGNVIADALLEYGQKQGWKSDLAFYNGAGVRSSLQIGDITFAKLAEVLPFQNTVVNVDLTGDQVKEVFEGMAGSAGRLFVSGGTMAYRFANGDGKRVIRATVGGQPLDPKRVYHVSTIDYLLGGGDGHTGFTKGTNVIYGDLDVDAVAPYFTAHSPLSPTSPGRVTQE
jgi:2',3'-cyclic-nucleotide 2'-phosphodiesterase (5'-nucleotidase family)